MRHIHLEDGLRLRFPSRNSDFDEGVEIGMLAALMSLGQSEIKRRVAAHSVEQVSCLAGKLGYHLAAKAEDAEWVDLTIRAGRARPVLRIVHSRDDAAPREAAG
jgi:hypothetical protein